MHPLAADTDPMKKDLMTMHVVAAVQKRLFIQSPVIGQAQIIYRAAGGTPEMGMRHGIGTVSYTHLTLPTKA